MLRRANSVASTAIAMVAPWPALASSAEVYVVQGINAEDFGAEPNSRRFAQNTGEFCHYGERIRWRSGAP